MPNDVSTFRRTGHRRDLNRPSFKAAALERRLDDPDSDATLVLQVLRHAMAIRGSRAALHPDADMSVLSEGRSDLVVLERRAAGESLVAVHNMTPTRLTLPLAGLGSASVDTPWCDCLQGRQLPPDLGRLLLEPYDVAWLVRS